MILGISLFGLPAESPMNAIYLSRSVFSQASELHSKESVLPVPVGDSNSAFCFFEIAMMTLAM